MSTFWSLGISSDGFQIKINIRHPGQLKKIQFWGPFALGPFWSYQLKVNSDPFRKSFFIRKILLLNSEDYFLISILGGGKLLEGEIDIQRREKTYSDRLGQIEHVKKVRAVGYRLYKSDPNRPPTPDPSGEIVLF